MSPFVFLLVPVVVIILASVVIYVRGHQPQNMHSGITSFEQEMRALSPDSSVRKPRRFEAENPTRSPRVEPVLPDRRTGDGGR